LAEWYLTFCLFIPLFEGKFYNFFSNMAESRSFILFRLTPWNLVPTELYFVGPGFFLGLLIYLMARRPDRVQVRGQMLLYIYWIILAIGVLHGLTRGTQAWLGDFRSFLLPSLVTFWAVVLADVARIDVVFNRLIRVAAVLALVHAAGAGLMYAHGGYQDETSLLSIEWRGCYVLLFYYCLAFARTVGSDRKTPVSLICLALGLVVPLYKPVLATFVATNFILFVLAMRSGRRFGNTRIGSVLLTLFLVGGVGAVALNFAMSLGRGYGKEQLLNRIFKYNQSYADRDVSGGRVGMWMHCLEEFAGSPAIGVGLGARFVVARTDKIMTIPIHNLYIQLLYQTGLVGFVPLAIIAVIWLARAYGTLAWEEERSRYWPRLGCFAFVLSVLLSSCYGDSLGVRAIAYTFWFAIAIETWAHSRVLAEQGR